MSEDNEITIKKVKSNYKPYLALALCWTDDKAKGLFYNYIQPSFAYHPCDLFDRKGNREEWKDLTGYEVDDCKNMFPEKANYLRESIAGGLQVSNFGRIGIPIKCEGKKGLCKGCEKCKLSPFSKNKVKVRLKKKFVKKCSHFHFILPQYEGRFWDNSQQEFKTYNGYLVVNINGTEKLVYDLVAEAFGLKEDIFQKTKEFMKKEKLDFGDDEKLKKANENDKLEIHHIDNNGHHNTPWNGTDGNLIALPKSVHNLIHGKS